MDRHATAIWSGNLKEGKGSLDTQSGALAGIPYSFKGMFHVMCGKSGSCLKELSAAALADCFAMQLSRFLAEDGTPAEKLDARALVTLVRGTGINASALTDTGKVPGSDAAKFMEL